MQKVKIEYWGYASIITNIRLTYDYLSVIWCNKSNV